jgi:hypothetical protein
MKKRILFSTLILIAGLFLFQLRYEVAKVQHTSPMPVYVNLLLTTL